MGKNISWKWHFPHKQRNGLSKDNEKGIVNCYSKVRLFYQHKCLSCANNKIKNNIQLNKLVSLIVRSLTSFFGCALIIRV